MRDGVGRDGLPRQTKHTFGLVSLYTDTLAASSTSSSSWLLMDGPMFLPRPFVRMGLLPPSSRPQYSVTARMALSRRFVSSFTVIPAFDMTELASSSCAGDMKS